MDIPHASRLVGRAGKDIGRVRVEGYRGDVGSMCSKDTKGINVVAGPKASGIIVRGCRKIVSKGAKGNIPKGLVVAFVDDERCVGF
jgi:hypothetical protein